MIVHDLDFENDTDASDSQAKDIKDNGEGTDQTEPKSLDTSEDSSQALKSTDTTSEVSEEAKEPTRDKAGEVDLESLEIEEGKDVATQAPEGKKAVSKGQEESGEVDLESLGIEDNSSKTSKDTKTATETQEELETRRAEFQAMQERIAEASSGEKGSEFEEWSNKWVFGDKHRVTIRPELNKHLEKVDPDGLGIATGRTSDNFVGSDGAIWDAKAYSEGSKISEDQLRDYSIMQKAGQVCDSQGNEIEVKSVNYLFSDKAAAESNASLLSYYGAIAWYVDDSGAEKPLENQ